MPALDSSFARDSSLKRGFAWMFAGNLVFTATQWGMLAVLTKLTSDAVSGQYGLGLSLATPVFMFAGLDLRLLLVTDSQRQYRLSEYLTLRLLCGGLALLAVLGLGLAWGWSGATLAVIMSVAFGKFVELIGDTYYGQIQSHERLDAVARSMMLHGVVSSAGFIAVLFFSESVFAACLAYAGGRLAALVWFDIPFAKRLPSEGVAGLARVQAIDRNSCESSYGNPVDLSEPRETSFARLFALAKTGAPLSVKTLLTSLNTHVARLFVAATFGLAGLGIFFPIAQLGFAGLTFSRSLNQSVAGRIGRLVQSGRMSEFRRLLRRLLGLYAGLGTACVGVALLAGPQLLTLVFDAGYAEHSLILTLVMVAMAVQFMTGILDLAMIALRRTMLPAWLSAASLGILSVACWQWVPVYGLPGAAAAMIVSRVPRPLILAWVVLGAEATAVESALDSDEPDNAAQIFEAA